MLRSPGPKNTLVFIGALAALACLRTCFAGVLLSDEDYHLAAALHILGGKAPYRDFWYDKPPLAALYYLPIQAFPGLLLRLWDALYILLCCFLAYRLARSWWDDSAGRAAAALLAFFTTFYLPSAVIPFAPDALLLAPHLAAVYCARQGKPWLAGALCGLGFWLNVKALFVAAACGLWLLSSWWSFVALAGGFSAVLAAGVGALGFLGMAAGYRQQVWVWGAAYAAGAPVAHPLVLAAQRVSHWLGFHAALALSWAGGFAREERRERLRLAAWLLLSFAAVCFGNHFAPRYFLQMLPPLAILGGRGVALAFSERRRFTLLALGALLLVPAVRFGPRYWKMAQGAAWSDIALDVDSRQAAARIDRLARPGDTLFVWGYRPDVYVYTRLPLASAFWDSQPLTGVAADRHLTANTPLPDAAARARLEAVEQSRPVFFVDGLGLLNANFDPRRFPEMRTLLENYREVARTRLSIIYRRKD